MKREVHIPTPLPRFDFAWSDPHISHGRIIGYTGRPFHQEHVKDSREMDKALLENYNQIVSPDDTTLWLGDAFFHMSRKWMTMKLEKFNGRKLLIRGNHDGSRAKMLDVGFEWVEREAFIEMAGKKIHLHHYPYLGKGGVAGKRNAKPQGEDVLIHGHTHSTTRIRDNQICMCVEAWDYRPVRREVVADLVRQITTLQE